MSDADPLAPPAWYPDVPRTAPAQQAWRLPLTLAHPLGPAGAELYYVPLPVCPLHGELRWDAARFLYYCPGYDAGDCSMTVMIEQLDIQYVGRVDG